MKTNTMKHSLVFDDGVPSNGTVVVGAWCENMLFRAERLAIHTEDDFLIALIMIGSKAQWARKWRGGPFVDPIPASSWRAPNGVKWDTVHPDQTIWLTVINQRNEPRPFRATVYGIAVADNNKLTRAY